MTSQRAGNGDRGERSDLNPRPIADRRLGSERTNQRLLREDDLVVERSRIVDTTLRRAGFPSSSTLSTSTSRSGCCRTIAFTSLTFAP